MRSYLTTLTCTYIMQILQEARNKLFNCTYEAYNKPVV